MKNTQLFTALKSLDRSGFRKLGVFIKSPYFNSRSEVIRFYEAIKKFYPEFKVTENDMENIFKKVYPGKKVNDVLFRKLISLTLNLFTEFIAIENFRENKLDSGVRMVNMIREKKLSSLFEKKSRALIEQMNSSHKGIEYYEARYKLTTIINGYQLNVNESSMVNKLQNELDDFLDYFYIIIFLFNIRLNTWSKVYKLNIDLGLSDEAFVHFGKKKNMEVTLATLYYYMIMLMKTEDEKFYTELVESRKAFEKQISPMDDYNVQLILMQFCHLKASKGYLEYRIRQHEINKTILEKHLIPEGYIEPYFFTNTVRNASKTGEFEWADNFITRFKSRLNPDFAYEIINYSSAILEFEKGSFQSALEKISRINIEKSNMKLEIKTLQVLNYYELGYRVELEFLLDSFKHFLQRENSIPDNLRQMYLESISLINRLNRLSEMNTKSKNEIYLFINELERKPYFNLKDWLLKKAKEI